MGPNLPRTMMLFHCKDGSFWLKILFFLGCENTINFVHQGPQLSNATGKLAGD